jgi:SAM-dependent methyltransferase
LDALKEIRRVLKPNGYLALLWHVDDCLFLFSSLVSYQTNNSDNGFQSDIPTTEWERIIKEHIWQHDDNVPRFRHGKWKAIFNAPGQTFFEQPVEEKDVPFTYYADVDALWGRLRTYSQFTNLEGEELQVSFVLFF